MTITQAPVPTLACIVGVTGEGGNIKDVVELVAIVNGRIVKNNNN
jgi:hypothetical protein